MVNALNDQQREAVRYVDGPLLVLAGAGSGKTSVITQKIVRLIDKHEVPAENVVAVTFTNKAAREMRERVKKLRARTRSPEPWISTFHTLGLRILAEEFAELGYRQGYSIFDANDTLNLIVDLMRRERGADLKPQMIQGVISRWKNNLWEPTRASEMAEGPVETLAAKIYPAYSDTLLALNSMDFDDLIRLPVLRLSTDRESLEKWSNRFQFLLVDEYQDTNSCQYELVRLLCGHKARLTAVGDDDQSIYAWRGAKPENIDELVRDFPQLKVVKLEQNYRSTGLILKCANQLIARNPHTIEKRLWSDRGFGDAIQIAACKDDEDESETVANRILNRRLLRGLGYGSFAVLFRGNYQARILEQAFREREIPYVVSGSRSFFDYSEIKDVIAYLRLISNPADDNAFLRIVNTPRRGIGTTTIKHLVAAAGERQEDLLSAALSVDFESRCSSAAFKRIRDFVGQIETLQRLVENESPDVIYKTLVNDIALKDWLHTNSATEPEAIRRVENIDELGRWIERIRIQDPNKKLPDVVAALTLYDIAEREESERDREEVSLMTIHAAKGLEFDHVYIVGFEEGLIPHHASETPAQIEEERRLAYVAITRAKKSLTISHCEQRKRHGKLATCVPSRFLEELPEEDLDQHNQPLDHEENRKLGEGTLDNLREMLKR